ncbi:ABC transporter substrate-binding protein [Devosia pacifica]|uniref:ABC transporter substrate-binding protein n=1 Tax=Devosia pacifica TaxID=1335967 RepID=A0A918RUT7_9HYPH|nr:extracellular solute-binding protein [Devosia pacifica]GHA10078.1 ABC transporter substrate-binding protein [Devosia pacifica]
MKNGLKSIALMGLGAALGSTSLMPAMAQDFSGQTLVVGVWGGDIERLLRENVIGPLEEETGANVELLLGGTGDRVAKIYAERANPTMDIAFLNIFEAPQALADGVVVAPDPDLQMYKDIWPGMNEGCYAMSLAALGIVYNKDEFESPPEWEDLWAPELQGRIALPPFPGSEANGILAIAGRLAGADEHDADASFDKLAELKPIPLTYTNLDELLLLTDAGEIAAAPIISGYAISGMENYENIGFSFPTDPGPVLTRDMLCLVANSPSPELAMLFAEKALGVVNQTAYANELYFGPTNSNVELEPAVSEMLIDTPEEVETLTELDWPYLIENRSAWTDRWNAEILAD